MNNSEIARDLQQELIGFVSYEDEIAEDDDYDIEERDFDETWER